MTYTITPTTTKNGERYELSTASVIDGLEVWLAYANGSLVLSRCYDDRVLLKSYRDCCKTITKIERAEIREGAGEVKGVTVVVSNSSLFD